MMATLNVPITSAARPAVTRPKPDEPFVIILRVGVSGRWQGERGKRKGKWSCTSRSTTSAFLLTKDTAQAYPIPRDCRMCR
jgi:hypothetical protein